MQATPHEHMHIRAIGKAVCLHYHRHERKIDFTNSNCNAWTDLQLMVDVTDIVPVEDGEPMVVTASHTVVFLSQYEDSKSHHALLPDTLNDPNAKVSKLRCFKNGNKTDLIYEVKKEVRVRGPCG